MTDTDLKYYLILDAVQRSKIQSRILSQSPISFSDLKYHLLPVHIHFYPSCSHTLYKNPPFQILSITKCSRSMHRSIVSSSFIIIRIHNIYCFHGTLSPCILLQTTRAMMLSHLVGSAQLTISVSLTKFESETKIVSLPEYEITF